MQSDVDQSALPSTLMKRITWRLAPLMILMYGFITAIPYAAAVVAVPLWGYLVSRRHVNALHLSAPLTVAALSLASALYLDSPVATIAMLAVGTAAGFCCVTTFWQLPSRILTGRAAAAGIALINCLGLTAGFLMPYFIGWTKDATGTFKLALFGIAMTMLFSATLATRLYLLQRRRDLAMA